MQQAVDIGLMIFGPQRRVRRYLAARINDLSGLN